MKEKINIYNISVVSALLLVSFFIWTDAYGNSAFLFLLMVPFFLAIIWFFSKDNQIREFKQLLSEKFPFLSKTLSVIFRIFVFFNLFIQCFYNNTCNQTFLNRCAISNISTNKNKGYVLIRWSPRRTRKKGKITLKQRINKFQHRSIGSTNLKSLY